MPAPAIRYARTDDGVTIAYLVLGSGPPLLVVFGGLMSGDIEAELRVERSLAFYEALGRERSLVIFDPRGFGSSDRGMQDFSIAALIGDAEAVMRHVGIDRADLFAAYRWAPAAIEWTTRADTPIDRMVLWHPYAGGANLLARPLAGALVPGALARAADGDDLRPYWELVLGVTGIPSVEIPAAVDLLDKAVTPATYNGLLAAIATWDVADRLEQVRVPTLVVHRAEERLLGPAIVREVAAGIPDAQLVVLEGDEFFPAYGDTQSALVAIHEFLQQSAAGEPALAMPSGFQTILFTDLEGSTALTQRLGDEGAQELLRGHNAAVRAALDEHGGHEVKHTGDGIMASFPSAVSAVTAALRMQRDLAGGEVRVRIGLNAGEPIAEDDDLFGLAVIKAARIGDRAEPGQVLVSNVVRELCEGKTFTFTSIGEVTLKGFEEPVALYEVRA